MSDPFGSSLFRVPVFFKEGTGINLEQTGQDQALTVSVSDDALAGILGAAVVSTDYQESVRVAATSNINLLSTQTIDGVELAVDDRVLLTGQTNAEDNRIWVVAAGAWTIAEGWDVTDTITSGTIVPIEEGTVNGGKIAQLTTTGTITLGTTDLAWEFLDTDDVFISNFIGRNLSAATATLNLTYVKNWVYLTRAGVQTVTIPNNAAAAHEIGTEIVVQMIGTGTKTIACSASVVLNGAAAGTGSLTLTAQRDAYVLKKRGVNAWEAAPLKAPTVAANPTESMVIACSDETTALTTGTAKVTFRMPYAFTLSAVRASLSTTQSSGSIFTVDINESGTTILSTKLTIDNGEETSTTAATAAVISDTALADDAEITIDIDQVGDGTAKGLKVVLIGSRT